MNIKAVILNHNEKEINDRIIYALKHGAGKEEFQFEKNLFNNQKKIGIY